MVAKNILRITMLILAFSVSSIFAATYYVDAVNGNDSNNGASSSTAWKSLSKVNSIKYNPGDQILFKRGNTWTGQLIPSSSGTSSSRIIYGAYGTGNKPVITLIQVLPGSASTANWKQYSSTVYYMKPSVAFYSEGRLWLNDKEYQWSTSGPGGINSTVRWCFDGTYLYVYSSGNPATYYSSIKYPGYGMAHTTLKIADKDYVTFQNLDIRGGYNTVTFAGSDYVIVEDCKLGWGALGRGVIGNTSSGISATDPTSDYNIFRRDTLDSGWRVVTIENRQMMDAMSLQNGASHWEIYDCLFKDWDHSCVQMYGMTAPVSYNKVYRNFITAPDIAFSRSFEVMSMQANLAEYNEFYRNHITDITVRAQIGGYYTKIYYNIFCDMKNSICTYLSQKSAEGVNIANFAGSVSSGVKVYNNTFYGLDRTALWDYVANSEFTNNLIIDCGREQSGLGIRVTGNGNASTKWRNNVIYTPGSSTSSYLVSWDGSGKTMSQFNALNGSGGCTISGNIQYLGTLSALVKNAPAKDYSPASGSIVINKGVDVGLTQDFFGNPIIGNPDIGAIESGSTSTTTTSAPAITSTVIKSAAVGQQYTYDVNASGNPAPTYSLKVYPSGMSINSTSGIISWIPSASGNYNVTVEANNGIGSPAQQSFTIAVTTSSTSTPPTSTLPAGIISYWKLDETTQGRYADLLGKNNATSSASPVPVTGLVSEAQQFNGSTAKIDAPVNSSLNFSRTTSFSVEFWYKGSSIPTANKAAVGRYCSEIGARWYVGVNANDGRAKFYMTGGGKSAAAYGSVIVDNKWHHITATKNGSTGSMKIYVDGALKSTVTSSFTIDFSSVTANLNIGWLSAQSDYSLNGSLDEIAIYNSELSSTDIVKHYNDGLSGLGYGTTNLLSKTESNSVNNGNSGFSNLSAKPDQFKLNQNYPNPFNPTTRIRYAISQPSNVTIKIYDIRGAEVMTLVNGEQTPGYYEVNFDGSRLASGTYIYQLRTSQYVETKKMMLIK